MLYRKILPLCLLILCLPILAARADGETDAAEADAANDAAEAASHTFLTVDGLSDGCSAADCAAFLRGECNAALVQTVAAATESDATDRIATSLLNLVHWSTGLRQTRFYGMQRSPNDDRRVRSGAWFELEFSRKRYIGRADYFCYNHH